MDITHLEKLGGGTKTALKIDEDNVIMIPNLVQKKYLLFTILLFTICQTNAHQY